MTAKFTAKLITKPVQYAGRTFDPVIATVTRGIGVEQIKVTHPTLSDGYVLLTRFRGERKWRAVGFNYDNTPGIPLVNGSSEMHLRADALHAAELFLVAGRTYL